MRHAIVLGTVLLAIVAVWLYQDRREIAWRAAGIQRLDPSLAGCALLLLAAALYVGAMLWRKNVGLALVGAVAAPLVLSLGSAVLRALLQQVAPKWFPEPPPSERSPASGATLLRLPTVTRSALGRPAPAFESVGTWLSTRGNCRNTAWTPATGPRTPRLAWRWSAPPARPEFPNYVHGAPAVDRQGTAYVATSRGLVGVDPDGRQLWSLGEGYAAAPALDPSGNVVSAFEGRVLVVSPGGEASWHLCAEISPGVVTVAEDGSMFVVGGGSALDSGRLTALRSDGTPRWSVSCLRGVEFPPAISSKGVVYMSSQDTIVWNPEDPSSGYDRFQVLSADGAEIERVDLSDEGYTAVWGTTAAMCLEDGTPVVGLGEGIRVGSGRIARRGWGAMAVDPDGTVYVSSSDGLAAIDLKSGREKWRAAAIGVELPIVDGDGTVYMGDRGSITAFSPAGTAIWSWAVPDADVGYVGWLQGLALGPGGALYVATRDALFALRS